MCLVKRKMVHQDLDYIYIIDFEATCLKDVRISPQEIIEFPCLKLNLWTGQVEERFHRYVKPVYKPKLSPFCVKLTGIKQSMVEDQSEFKEVFEQFLEWFERVNNGSSNFAFATCGDWDLLTMLPNQLSLYKGMEVPEFMRSWINLKRTFETHTKKKISRAENDLTQMMKHFELDLNGHLHSGIDDVQNMAKLALKLCEVTRLVVDGGDLESASKRKKMNDDVIEKRNLENEEEVLLKISTKNAGTVLEAIKRLKRNSLQAGQSELLMRTILENLHNIEIV